jgi:hypothetical protein
MRRRQDRDETVLSSESPDVKQIEPFPGIQFRRWQFPVRSLESSGEIDSFGEICAVSAL